MASTPKPQRPQHDLPDLASVLRAIHADPETERRTKESQMRLLRRQVKKKYSQGLPEDEVDATANRLRNKLMRDFQQHGIRNVPVLVKWGKTTKTNYKAPDFSVLFYSGLNAFEPQYLQSLGIDHTPDNEGDGVVQPEGSQVRASSRSAVTKSRGQQQQQEIAGSIEQSQKRKLEETRSEIADDLADVQMKERLERADTHVKKRLKLEHKETSSPIELSSTSSGGGVIRYTSVQEGKAEMKHIQAGKKAASEPVAAGESQNTRRNESRSQERPPRGTITILRTGAVKQAVQPNVMRTIDDDAIVIPHQDWVETKMKKIESRIWEATLAYFQEKNRADMAPATFVANPEPELEAVYKRLFGQKWKIQICDVQDQGPVLKQIYVVQALFGAALYEAVFDQDSSQDLQFEMRELLGAGEKYFNAAMVARGQNPVELLKEMACRQASDPQFQKLEVGNHARKLCGSAAMTLQPHLQKLSTRQEQDERLEYKHWSEYLEEAFAAAITLHQVMKSTDMGPYEVMWPKSDTQLNEDDHHRLRYDLSGDSAADDRRVLYALLPEIQRWTEDAMLVYCRALVIPAASKEVLPPKATTPRLVLDFLGAHSGGSGDHAQEEEATPRNLTSRSKAVQADISETDGHQEGVTPVTLASMLSMATAAREATTSTPQLSPSGSLTSSRVRLRARCHGVQRHGRYGHLREEAADLDVPAWNVVQVDAPESSSRQECAISPALAATPEDLAPEAVQADTGTTYVGKWWLW